MVERPIKKSERQVSTEVSDVVAENPTSEPDRVGDDPEQALKTEPYSEGKRGPNQQDRSKSRKKGGGNRQREQETARVNPALLRGPKPTKPKPPVTHKEATTGNSAVVVEDQDTPTES